MTAEFELHMTAEYQSVPRRPVSLVVGDTVNFDGQGRRVYISLEDDRDHGAITWLSVDELSALVSFLLTLEFELSEGAR